MQGGAHPLWMRPLKPPEGARKPPGCSGSASIIKSVATRCAHNIHSLNLCFWQKCRQGTSQCHSRLRKGRRAPWMGLKSAGMYQKFGRSRCLIAGDSRAKEGSREEPKGGGTWNAVLLRAWASSNTAWPSHEWRRVTPNAKPSRLPELR